MGKPKNGLRSIWFDTAAHASTFVEAFNEQYAIVEGVRASLNNNQSEGPQPGIHTQLNKLSHQVAQLMKQTQTKQGQAVDRKTPGQKKQKQYQAQQRGGNQLGKKKSGVCYFYSRFGNCKFGARCNREHVERVTNPHEKKAQFEKKVTQVTGGAVAGPQAPNPPLGGPPFYQKANSSNAGHVNSPHHYHPPQFWGSPATPAFQNGSGDGYHPQRPSYQYWQHSQFPAGHYNPQWGTGREMW
jgi:hypothetical protein